MELSTNYPPNAIYCTDEYARKNNISDRPYTPITEYRIRCLANDFKVRGKYFKRNFGDVDTNPLPVANGCYIGRGLVGIIQNQMILLTHETPAELEELAKSLGLPKPNIIDLDKEIEE